MTIKKIDKSEIGGRRWFVAQTHPHREFEVAHRFGEQGFEHFLPLFKKAIKRTTIGTKTAFFPCYLFVAFDPRRDRWLCINSTIGVKSLVMTGETPLPVQLGVVEQLQAMTDERGYVRFGTDLNVGDDIKIINGPLAEMVGRVERLDGKRRVQVLIEIINGHVPVNLPRENLVKAAPVER